jgi:hypothetical protein
MTQGRRCRLSPKDGPGARPRFCWGLASMELHARRKRDSVKGVESQEMRWPERAASNGYDLGRDAPFAIVRLPAHSSWLGNLERRPHKRRLFSFLLPWRVKAGDSAAATKPPKAAANRTWEEQDERHLVEPT